MLKEIKENLKRKFTIEEETVDDIFAASDAQIEKDRKFVSKTKFQIPLGIQRLIFFFICFIALIVFFIKAGKDFITDINDMKNQTSDKIVEAIKEARANKENVDVDSLSDEEREQYEIIEKIIALYSDDEMEDMSNKVKDTDITSIVWSVITQDYDKLYEVVPEDKVEDTKKIIDEISKQVEEK